MRFEDKKNNGNGIAAIKNTSLIRELKTIIVTNWRKKQSLRKINSLIATQTKCLSANRESILQKKTLYNANTERL